VTQPFLIDGLDPTPGDKQGNAPNAGNGRPKGVRNRKHAALEAAARSRALPLLLKVIEQAEAGDMMAAKIVLDRVWPKPRTAPITLELPATETPADVRAAMMEIIQRVSRGEVTTDDGAALVAMMKDILDAHSIKTLSPDSDNQSLSGDAKQIFSDRLARIIETRATPVEDPAA
jgi:hypothetical protein